MKTVGSYNPTRNRIIYELGQFDPVTIAAIASAAPAAGKAADGIIGAIKNLFGFGGCTGTKGCCDFCSGTKVGSINECKQCDAQFTNTYACPSFNKSGYFEERLATGRNYPCNGVRDTGRGTIIITVPHFSKGTREIEISKETLGSIGGQLTEAGFLPTGISQIGGSFGFLEGISTEQLLLWGGGALVLVLLLTGKRKR